MSFTSAPMPRMTRSAVIPLPKIENPTPAQKESLPSCYKLDDIQKENNNEREPPKGNILHISNIPSKLTYEEIKQGLYKLFSVHGPIYEILIKTKDSGQHFAFVDYPEIKDAEKACLCAKKEGKVLQGKRLLVNYCEDPKKNNDRKSQKCYLCHGIGHKAIKCHVKPEMIKPKIKKYEVQTVFEEETCDLPKLSKQNNARKCEQDIKQSSAEESEEESQSNSDEESLKERSKKRNKDYLRYLKLKKKILKQKLKKKIRKMKKKKQ